MMTTEDELVFQSFKRTMNSLGKFSGKELDMVATHLKILAFPKGHRVISEGKVCQAIYFVQRGSFRHYQVTEKGEDLTQNLYVENDWMLEYKSFTSQQPSASIIEATENSEVLELGVYDLHKLMKLSDAFFQMARIFQYAVKHQETNIQTATPQERYRHLLATKPVIIQRFPLKYIASYLNMAPETLSRVRRSLHKFSI